MQRNYPIHADLGFADGVQQVRNIFGTYFLPMAFPEGCPLHPAYGAGHATVAGACVTILKAWFKEDFEIPKPQRATLTGECREDYNGTLTVGGELNKLASNVSLGRNFAGVHWRSDYTESIKLGEQVAISLLEDQACTYNEDFELSLTKFSGQTIKITKRGTCPK